MLELLIKARKGHILDQIAYNKVAFPYMTRIANKFLHDDQLAKDVANDVMLMLLTTNNDLTELNYASYTHKCIKNRVIDYVRYENLRADAKNEVIKEFDELSNVIETEQYIIESTKLNKILSKLPYRYRTILQLKYLEKWSYKRLAAYYDTTIRKIYKQVENAIKTARILSTGLGSSNWP
jgi:RNA polymerase sigma factor (sigma-70 family)